MKEWKESVRWFLMGLIPTFCVLGLVFGGFFVWYRTRAVMLPERAPLRVEMEAPGRWKISEGGKSVEIELPDVKLPEIFAQVPALIPRRVRLAAWVRGKLCEIWPVWEEYLRGKCTG